MTQQLIITTPANTGLGSSPKAAFDICNANFTELYGAGSNGLVFGPSVLGPTVTINPPTITGISLCLSNTNGTDLLTGTTIYNANQSSGSDPAHLIDINNDNSASQVLRISSYGSAGSLVGQNNLHWQRANGTLASPTATLNGDVFMSMGYRGHNGTNISASVASFSANAIENFTSTAGGMNFQFQLSPTGSIVRQTVLTLAANGSSMPAAASGITLALASAAGFPSTTFTGPSTVPLSIQEMTAAPVSQLSAFIGIATATFPGASGINGDLVLIPRTSNSCAINFATGNGTPVVRMQIPAAGTVIFAPTVAPAAGGSVACGIQASSTANLGFYFGTGAPTFSAGQGSIYSNTTGAAGARLYVNTNGSNGWAAAASP